MPLNITVLGIVAVVFNDPAEIVSELAIPNTALVASFSSVPVSVTSNRLAVPFKVAVPVNVAIDGVLAANVPLTLSADPIEKFTAEVTDPVTVNALNDLVPAPEMVLPVPLIVTVPVLAVKEPDTTRFPVIVIDDVVVTVPDTVRLSNAIPVPVIVFDVPLMVSVPAVCVNEPEAVVTKLPATDIAAAVAVAPEEVIVRLLKLCTPEPLITAPGPVSTTVPVLPVNTPLLVQLPPTESVNEAPSNVVDTPIVTLPPILRLAAAVNETEAPDPSALVRLPEIVIAVAGIVLTDAAPEEPLKVRLP